MLSLIGGLPNYKNTAKKKNMFPGQKFLHLKGKADIKKCDSRSIIYKGI